MRVVIQKNNLSIHAQIAILFIQLLQLTRCNWPQFILVSFGAWKRCLPPQAFQIRSFLRAMPKFKPRTFCLESLDFQNSGLISIFSRPTERQHQLDKPKLMCLNASHKTMLGIKGFHRMNFYILVLCLTIKICLFKSLNTFFVLHFILKFKKYKQMKVHSNTKNTKLKRKKI